MFVQDGPVILLLLAGMAGSVYLKKLTLAGAIIGGAIGYLVFLAFDFAGLLLMALFFVLGTAATAWRKREKMGQGLAEAGESKRTAGQVAANAGVAGLLAIWVLVQKEATDVFALMMAAVFSSATADTLSSELGNVYGKRFYNILNLKKDTKGLNGVVSLEGTAAGIAGSLLIALLYMAFHGWNNVYLIIIILAGTIGNFCDSLLGATLERKGWLGNNAVNFLNTAVAALAAYGLYFLLNGQKGLETF